MCLTVLYTDEKKQEFLKDKPEWIKVYKLVHERDENFCGIWKTEYNYEDGLNISPEPDKPEKPFIEGEDKDASYIPYFHFFLELPTFMENVRVSLVDYANSKLIYCWIKKENIDAVGKWGPWVSSAPSAVTAKEAIFPTFPNIELTEEELKKFGIIK